MRWVVVEKCKSILVGIFQLYFPLNLLKLFLLFPWYLPLKFFCEFFLISGWELWLHVAKFRPEPRNPAVKLPSWPKRFPASWIFFCFIDFSSSFASNPFEKGSKLFISLYLRRRKNKRNPLSVMSSWYYIGLSLSSFSGSASN